MTDTDRVAFLALALADVGLGLYLIGAGVPADGAADVLHVVVGVVALLLAMPAAVAGSTGRLPPASDVGVLVNVGALVFLAVIVATATPDPVEAVGLALVVVAAAAATASLWVRLFGIVRGAGTP